MPAIFGIDGRANERWKRKMHTQQEPDSALEDLEDYPLRIRLALTDWEDPQYISTEQVLRLFSRAQATGNHGRMGTFAAVLSRRLLVMAKAFAVRSGIYPENIGDLGQAAEEISQFVWECLVTRPKDAAYAEKYFGRFFKCRSLDFLKGLSAKKRRCQDSLDAMEHTPDNEDSEQTITQIAALRQDSTPADALEAKQEYALTSARLQSILTSEEFSVYVMLHGEEMSVQDIATALGVTTRTVNNYKNRALDKVRKEFNP